MLIRNWYVGDLKLVASRTSDCVVLVKAAVGGEGLNVDTEPFIRCRLIEPPSIALLAVDDDLRDASGDRQARLDLGRR